MQAKHCRLDLRIFSSVGFLVVLIWAHPVYAGWHIGSLDCTPNVELSGIYDDNVFLRNKGDPQSPVEDDFMGRISPGIHFRYSMAPTNFDLNYSTEFLFYRRQSELDTNARNHTVRLSAARQINPRSSISLSDDVSLGTDIARIPQEQAIIPTLGIIPRGRDYVLNSTRLESSYSLSGRWSLTGSLQYGYHHFGALSGDNVGQGAPETEPATTDNLWDGTLSTAYAWHRRNSFLLSFGISHYDYQNRGLSTTYSLSAGDRWQITPRLEISATGGASFLRQWDIPSGQGLRDEESVHPLANLTASYGTEYIRVSAILGYELSASSGIGATVETRSGTVSIEYTGWHYTSVSVWERISQSKSSGDVGQGIIDVVNYLVGGNLKRQISEWLTVTIDYSFIDQHSEQNTLGSIGGTYTDNRVTIGIVAALPDMR